MTGITIYNVHRAVTVQKKLATFVSLLMMLLGEFPLLGLNAKVYGYVVSGWNGLGEASQATVSCSLPLNTPAIFLPSGKVKTSRILF